MIYFKSKRLYSEIFSRVSHSEVTPFFKSDHYPYDKLFVHKQISFSIPSKSLFNNFLDEYLPKRSPKSPNFFRKEHIFAKSSFAKLIRFSFRGTRKA